MVGPTKCANAAADDSDGLVDCAAADCDGRACNLAGGFCTGCFCF